MITSAAERPDWYADPSGRYPLRYWDGHRWTSWVAVDGHSFVEGAGDPAGVTRPLARTGSDLARDPVLRWLIPVGRSPWAIAAGYAGLFAFLIFPAPIALGLGLVALVRLHRRPEQLGRGRAIFGVTVGGLGTLLLLVALAG